MKKIFQKILHVVQQGQHVALATVISSKGSLPMSKRAKMLVFEDGSIMGTIGGGLLEANVMKEARQVLTSETPKVVKEELTSEQIEADGLTCGGTVEIFIEPFTPHTDMTVIQEIVHAYQESQTAVVATLIGANVCPKLLVREDESVVGTFGHGAIDQKIIEMARPHLGEWYLETMIFDPYQDQAQSMGIRSQMQNRVCFETILPPPTAYLFGGGHVSQHLATILHFIGFEYVVIDDRKEFVTRERFPQAKGFVYHSFEQVLDELTLTPHSSYLIIVTRGHKSDLIVLEQALQADVKYIGMIGSKRKITLMLKHFLEQGVPQEALEKVYAPIGIDTSGSK